MSLEDLAQDSLMVYGVLPQLYKTGEEAAELAAAISKYAAIGAYIRERGWTEQLDNLMAEAWTCILDELCDVKIMMAQMELQYSNLIEERMPQKLDRALNRVKTGAAG